MPMAKTDRPRDRFSSQRSVADGARLIAVSLASLALISTVGAPAAAAFPDYNREERIPKTIGVIAFRNYALNAEQIFRPRGEPLPGDQALFAAQDYLQHWLRRHEDVELIRDRDLRDRIAAGKTYREGILAAREWFNIGVDQYRELRAERSVENLERAETLYLEVFQDVVEPYALAELELHRGLSLLEQGHDELAHVALKRLFFFDPWRRFDRGYHPSPTETALQGALVDLNLTGTPEMVLLNLDRVEQLLRTAELDGVMFGYLEHNNGGEQILRVVLFEGEPARITFRDRVVLPDEDHEGLNRLLSRFAGCARYRHPTPPKRPEHARFLFDIGFVESFPLVHPTRDLFHQLGLSLGTVYRLSRGLDLFGRLMVATTLSDPKLDLMRSSTTLRATAGVGFAFQRGRLRWFLHPGVQLAAVPEMAWSTNPYCKLYANLPREQRAPLCREGDISELAGPVLLGIDLSLGMDVFVTNELFVGLRAGATAYLVPRGTVGDFNFPLTFQVSLGYAL